MRVLPAAEEGGSAKREKIVVYSHGRKEDLSGLTFRFICLIILLLTLWLLTPSSSSVFVCFVFFVLVGFF